VVKRRRIWRWALLALILGGIGYGSAQVLLGPRVIVHSPVRRDLLQTVVASGRVLAPTRVSLASTVTGRVTRVLAQEGDHVRTGQLLVELERDEALAAVSQARAGVAQARARLEQLSRFTSLRWAEEVRQAEANFTLARTEYERTRRLVESGAAPGSQLDNARKTLDLARSRRESTRIQLASAGPQGSERRLAEAALRLARANLDLARAQLAKLRIVASGHGIVLTRSVEPGEVVQPGRTLLVLAKDAPIQLVVQLDEKNLALVRPGQTARASADAFPNDRFAARVAFLAPLVDAQRGTVEVRLDVPRPPPYLRPDMTVSVDIEVGHRPNALALPAEDIREATGGSAWVLVVRDHRAERRPVQIGVRGEGMVEVLEGLAEGDAVIPPAAGPIQPGQRVRATRATPTLQAPRSGLGEAVPPPASPSQGPPPPAGSR
jgi:HlyD family secretion protein